MILSILIPTLPERTDLLCRLMKVLHPQLTAGIEVVFDAEKGITIGEKRQRMLENANGEYIVFIDDDDLISKDYISQIMEALKRRPDTVGFNGQITSLVNNKTCLFVMTKDVTHWHTKDNVFYRNTEHLCPVKKEIALKAGFTYRRKYEDMDYSKAIAQYIDTEVYIDKVLYYYLARYKF